MPRIHKELLKWGERDRQSLANGQSHKHAFHHRKQVADQMKGSPGMLGPGKGRNTGGIYTHRGGT